jgi:hypothetical protein
MFFTFPFMQTYDELIEQASKGNLRNVNQYTDEVFLSNSNVAKEENFYTKTEEATPIVIYSFGKAASGQGKTCSTSLCHTNTTR